MLQSAYDVAVIGADSFGAWTAWHLRRAGQSVLLPDVWSPGHSGSSSGGESRAIRMGYGADEIYARMSMRSLGLWQDLFRQTGQPLFHRTGVLWMAREDDPYSDATHRTLAAAGVPMEIVPSGEIARRYPQMRLNDPKVYGIFEPESGALMARRAVAAVVEDAARRGMAYATEAVLTPSVAGRGRRSGPPPARRFLPVRSSSPAERGCPNSSPAYWERGSIQPARKSFSLRLPPGTGVSRHFNCRCGSTSPTSADPTGFPTWRAAASNWVLTGMGRISIRIPAIAV